MKRFLSVLLALMLMLCAFAVSESSEETADPTVYPGIVAPLDESYVFAPVKALDGEVLASGGLYLHVAPDISSDVLVLVPCGAEFKLIAKYANGNIRVSLGLGKEFYTGYFCTDLSEEGKLWTTSGSAVCNCTICPTCNGAGFKTVYMQCTCSLGGSPQSDCPVCGGTGQSPYQQMCSTCGGKGCTGCDCGESCGCRE